MNEAISIIDLSFDYPDMLKVLNGITLTVNVEESVGIIGPNGAGKTTLFHLICGLLKPKSGIISVFGKSIQVNTFNPDIGYIFQNPDDQLFNTTVFEDVAFGPVNMGLKKEEVMFRVDNALRAAGCLELKNRPSHHLSGGEKRMVSVATIIAMYPKIVIYDEPTANLDMRSRRTVIDFIKISKETKLIASHDLEFILETCNRVVVLDEGRIVSDGVPQELMNDEKFMQRHGLERPHSLLHLKKKHSH